uniref:Sorting nexin 10a n=1 Tax=Paramormyrops kingsleyae TaxID=1676925 RepID=A0A3B3R1H5_9TELE|nr:sorting nexin-10B-like isoform X1 [Paramormyrops kingsleyae]XP_023673390.1 sorting nexin-10B-like isoform X1 [Paramormyrops kingsleyae]XP_023673391.1 sorting nexin-10B-like isoform X1 [Paramormyrops kingsleyae]XP_023673392.1 sorting nexin-10B-like isoform X1 [Paramormyrops kingsleyae]XP_023673393.1 sorting nexin-10B-like isoform X1 [Paramormyrops kingsleyae]
MDDGLTKKEEFVSVWVRDPRIQKDDYWHTHLDYEICLHTNSMCFRRKISCVRRRYREFVWLRQRLQDNTFLIELPKLPPRNPFFSQSNSFHINKRMKKLQQFLEELLDIPLLLSDSCLHLFLQSELSVSKIEACASGLTRYSVAEAIQRCGPQSRFPSQEALCPSQEALCPSQEALCPSQEALCPPGTVRFTLDLDSTSSSCTGTGSDPGTPEGNEMPQDDSPPS